LRKVKKSTLLNNKTARQTLATVIVSSFLKCQKSTISRL